MNTRAEKQARNYMPSSQKSVFLQGSRFEIDKNSADFPDILKKIPRPPKKLFMIGHREALSEGLAIVGARNATPYGISCAQRFSRIAAARGITIISGGAYGCDAAAHEAALATGGSTVVFLGGGCDKLYPARHVDLFQKIIDNKGAVVSEYSWEVPPLPYAFRERNRLIAGLARATLIVEAGLPSGTFSTADEALAAGKEVLVVPGSINSQTSQGANRLLYQGALPVVDDDSFEDYLFSFFGALKQEHFGSKNKKYLKKHLSLSRSQKLLYEALCAQPMRIEEMITTFSSDAKKTFSRQQLLIDIAELQKHRLIGRYPDGRFGFLA